MTSEDRANVAEAVDQEVEADRPDRTSVAEPADREVPAERERNAEGPAEGSSSLFAEGDAARYREKWHDLQSRFVDEPRQAVEGADKLVTEVIKDLAAVFDRQQKELESQLQASGTLSTEDLRMALQRYRTFFDRLLSV